MKNIFTASADSETKGMGPATISAPVIPQEFGDILTLNIATFNPPVLRPGDIGSI